MLDNLNRRQLLTSGGATTVALLAGCGGQQGDGGSDGGSSDGSGSDGGSSDGSGSDGTNTNEPGEQVGTQTMEVGQLTYFPDLGQQMKQQWGELGVDFEVETSTWGSFVTRIYVDNKFTDSTLSPWGSSPDRIDPNFHLSTYSSDSSLNISGYSNEEYDKAFQNQKTAFDEEERNEYIKQCQTILREDLPEIVINWPKATLPVNSSKWNIKPTKFIGARTTGTMTVLTAEPTGDTQRLVVGAQQELTTPNPLAPGSNDVQYLFKMAYDTPRRVGLDGTAQNWAVEEFENVDDSTIDMTLREGMKWHDGEDVTVDDLKFTFDFFTEYSFPKYDPYVSSVESTSIQTDRTLRVSLKEPNVAFLTSAMTFMNILPKHIWESVPDKVDQPVNYNMPVDEMVASGPLKITDKTTDELQMEKFDDHFHDLPYEEFVFVNRASTEAIRAGFVEQNIHMTTSSPSPSVTNELAKKDYIKKSVAPSVLQMKFSFDLSTKPWNDPAFRRALLAATDAKKISQLFFNGAANEADGTIIHPEQKWGRNDLESVGSADVEKAKSILRDAGYTYDNNGNLHYPS
ncbi:ABC transporter substrate-binding protein [Halobellus marinus]|uniref:ABC transporter substrate-binding protein n=1 Tax=Halobellus TaxID=1073986 RepID=UPI0028A96EFF|nr:ABC transporter substrate-binding protein [Halobellus sp. DFY28]